MSSLPRFLYHGTRLSNLESVLQHGIRPRGDLPSNWPKQPSHPGCVYLTTNQGFTYGQCWGTETKVVVFEIELKRLLKWRLLPDEDFIADALANQPGAKRTYHEIVPEVVDDLFLYRRNWEKSVLGMGTLAHFGVIPTVAITRYCIVDYEKRDLHRSTSVASAIWAYQGLKEENDQNTKWFFGDVDECYNVVINRKTAQQSDDPEEWLSRMEFWLRESRDRTGIHVVDLNPVKRKSGRRRQVTAGS